MCPQVKTKGARRITFGQFAEALALVAAKTNSNLADVASAVLAADGPSVTGTKAEYVKFHDDKVSAPCHTYLLHFIFTYKPVTKSFPSDRLVESR